MDLISISQDST